MRDIVSLVVFAGLLSSIRATAIDKSRSVRAANVCQRSDIVLLDKLLAIAPQPASKFCSEYLHYSTPAPASTTTFTARSVASVTSVETSTVVSSTTVTQTTTTTAPGPTETTTVTVTSTTAAPVVMRRGLQERSYPTPACLVGKAQSIISAACSCYVPKPTSSPPIVVTATSFTTETVVSTTYTTTVAPTTETTTSTTSGPASTSTSLDVRYVTVSYQKQNIPDSSCTYNRYTDGFEVDNSPDNNYRTGINQCEGFCTARPDCKFFFYLRFDPARARGADYGFCFIDNLPYDPSYLQCGYPTQKDAAYNKNP